MAHQSKIEELSSAWKALAGSTSTEGWRAINISTTGACKIKAARKFPGNEEAILIGFNNIKKTSEHNFPKGNGFSVSYADLGNNSENLIWISIYRELAGSLDLFSRMSDDILFNTERLNGSSDETVFSLVISRIFAWQDFMRRSKVGVLGSEEEIGLFGELVIINNLLEKEIQPKEIIEAWHGPLDSIQDFYFGKGAIEIKSTISSDLEVNISSLEQLDNTLINPLFLMGVRLELAEDGINLNQMIEKLRCLITIDKLALDAFNGRLLHAGYYDDMSGEYTRRFNLLGIDSFEINKDFPRIIKPMLLPEIVKAKYQINLTKFTSSIVKFEDAISQLRNS